MALRFGGKVLLATVTLLFLLSMGAQAVAGPILVPLHIYCVRTGTVFGSAGWIVLGSLLSLETAYVYTLVFHAWWGPVIATAALVLGLGGVLLAAVTKRDA
jgi:hypothetical protein